MGAYLSFQESCGKGLKKIFLTQQDVDFLQAVKIAYDGHDEQGTVAIAPVQPIKLPKTHEQMLLSEQSPLRYLLSLYVIAGLHERNAEQFGRWDYLSRLAQLASIAPGELGQAVDEEYSRIAILRPAFISQSDIGGLFEKMYPDYWKKLQRTGY